MQMDPTTVMADQLLRLLVIHGLTATIYAAVFGAAYWVIRKRMNKHETSK